MSGATSIPTECLPATPSPLTMVNADAVAVKLVYVMCCAALLTECGQLSVSTR
jgi:hypothetical protein